MSETGRRLAMIGVDAASIDFISEQRSSLPAFDRLLSAGSLGMMRSTADLLPGSVWPAFSSGLSPGLTGVYGHIQWDARLMRQRRMTAQWPGFPLWWLPLEEQGIRLLLVDIPFSFEPRISHGVQLSDWSTHDRLIPFTTQPPELRQWVEERYGSDLLGYEVAVEKSPAQLRRFYTALLDSALKRGELGAQLASRHDWDVFLCVFTETHRGGHMFWPDPGRMDPRRLLEIYRAVDAGLARILDALPEDAGVVVFSVHGMKRDTTQDGLVPAVVDAVNGVFRGEAPSTRGSAVRSALGLVRSTVPQALQYEIIRRFPRRFKDALADKLFTGGMDWPRTPGLAVLSDGLGYVRLNVAGRERDGMLQAGSADARRYVELLEEVFLSLVDGRGERLTAAVHRTADELAGPKVDLLPDIVVAWGGAPPATSLTGAHIGSLQVPAPTPRTGTHNGRAFFLSLGDAARLPQPEHITDIGGFVASYLRS